MYRRNEKKVPEKKIIYSVEWISCELWRQSTGSNFIIHLNSVNSIDNPAVQTKIVWEKPLEPNAKCIEEFELSVR